MLQICSRVCSKGYTCTIQPKSRFMNRPPAAAHASAVLMDPSGPIFVQSAVAAVYELRKAGFSADHDHAGRSPKGQITYGQKHARATVVIGDRWTVRRTGELDVVVDGIDELEELLA